MRIYKQLSELSAFPPTKLAGALFLMLALQTYCPAQQATTALAPATDTTSAAKLKSAPTPALKPIKIGSVTFTGSIRARWENTDWYDSDKANGSYDFGGAILRASLGQSKEKYDWQVEAALPILIGLPNTALAPAPQGQLGLGASYFAANGKQDGSVLLKQAFIRFKGLFGDKGSSLRLGRFEFNDGA